MGVSAEAYALSHPVEPVEPVHRLKSGAPSCSQPVVEARAIRCPASSGAADFLEAITGLQGSLQQAHELLGARLTSRGLVAASAQVCELLDWLESPTCCTLAAGGQLSVCTRLEALPARCNSAMWTFLAHLSTAGVHAVVVGRVSTMLKRRQAEVEQEARDLMTTTDFSWLTDATRSSVAWITATLDEASAAAAVAKTAASAAAAAPRALEEMGAPAAGTGPTLAAATTPAAAAAAAAAVHPAEPASPPPRGAAAAQAMEVDNRKQEAPVVEDAGGELPCPQTPPPSAQVVPAAKSSAAAGGPHTPAPQGPRRHLSPQPCAKRQRTTSEPLPPLQSATIAAAASAAPAALAPAPAALGAAALGRVVSTLQALNASLDAASVDWPSLKHDLAALPAPELLGASPSPPPPALPPLSDDCVLLLCQQLVVADASGASSGRLLALVLLPRLRALTSAAPRALVAALSVAAAAHPRSLLECVLSPLVRCHDLSGPQAQAVMRVARDGLPLGMRPALLDALAGGSGGGGAGRDNGQSAATTAVQWGEAHVGVAQGVLEMKGLSLTVGASEMSGLLRGVALVAEGGALAGSVPFSRLLLTLAGRLAVGGGEGDMGVGPARELLRAAAARTQTFLTPAVLAKLAS